MFVRLSWVVLNSFAYIFQPWRAISAWKAEVKMYRSVYKIMPSTFCCSEWQEFRTEKQSKKKQQIGNFLLTFWGEKIPNNRPCLPCPSSAPLCPPKTKQLRKTQMKQNTDCRETRWQAIFCKADWLGLDFKKCTVFQHSNFRNQTFLVAFYRFYRESLLKPCSSASSIFFHWRTDYSLENFLLYLIRKSTMMIKFKLLFLKCFYVLLECKILGNFYVLFCTYTHTLKNNFNTDTMWLMRRPFNLLFIGIF